jgi:hypothetical protein
MHTNAVVKARHGKVRDGIADGVNTFKAFPMRHYRLAPIGWEPHNLLSPGAMYFVQPVQAAVNRHVGTAIRNQQRTVHAMPPCSYIDLAASAKEGEHHIRATKSE